MLALHLTILKDVNVFFFVAVVCAFFFFKFVQEYFRI